MPGLPFYGSCVNWPGRLDVLKTLIANSRQITRRTFLQHVDRDELHTMERELGYEAHPARGLTMASDWHVSYHTYRGVYYFMWSHIEHVFATPALIKQIIRN